MERTKERIYIKTHYSHSSHGRPERIRGHYAEREEPYPRGEKLGIRMRHHPHYKAHYSPKRNAYIGYEAAMKRHESKPWLHTERELDYIGLLNRRTNPRASNSFYAAAHYAKHRHEQSQECDAGCRLRHKREG